MKQMIKTVALFGAGVFVAATATLLLIKWVDVFSKWINL